MAYAKFISTGYIFENSVLDKNVDPALINQFIEESQDIHIQELIGVEMYRKLMNEMDASGNTSSTGLYYRLLTEHIQPTQTKWVLFRLLPFLNYHLTNKAVSEKSSEHSKATELETLQYLRNIAETTAESYSARLRDFIKNNISSFPELYQIYGFGLRPEEQNFFGGMYLPNKKRC